MAGHAKLPDLAPEGYELIKLIGAGSFATVWQGKARGGVLVAIKRINAPITHEDAKRELASLELTKNLGHPGLLQMHAFFEKDGHIWVVMELADSSLRDRLNNCKKAGWSGVPPDELITYIMEAAEAVDYLHQNKINKLIHRDIKPENILLRDGHAKVADFGLARLLKSQWMTFSGAGTPAYMSPEVWNGKQVGPPADQYSLAVSYVELRQGRRPFTADNLTDLMMAHQHETPKLESLPEAERAVLLKALAKTPAARHVTCTEFARALVEVAKRPADRVTLGADERVAEKGRNVKKLAKPWLPIPGGYKTSVAILLTLILVLALLGLGLWFRHQLGHATEPVPLAMATSAEKTSVGDLPNDNKAIDITNKVLRRDTQERLAAGIGRYIVIRRENGSEPGGQMIVSDESKFQALEYKDRYEFVVDCPAGQGVHIQRVKGMLNGKAYQLDKDGDYIALAEVYTRFVFTFVKKDIPALPFKQ